MARKNPTMPKDSSDLPSPIPGIDNLPNAVGVNQSVLKEGNEMPGNGGLGQITVSMSPNDGDQRDVATPPYANGKDVREYNGSPSSNPWPAKPGC